MRAASGARDYKWDRIGWGQRKPFGKRIGGKITPKSVKKMGQRALVVRKRKKKQQTNQNMSNINKHNSCKKKWEDFVILCS